MDFFKMYMNPKLLASVWPFMTFLDKCVFKALAKRWNEISKIARLVVAEAKLKAHLVEELGLEEAEELWKALNDDFSADSTFWQSETREDPNEGEKTASEKKPGKYKHLSLVERAQIIALRNMKLGIRKIAAQMNRNPSTISRELRT